VNMSILETFTLARMQSNPALLARQAFVPLQCDAVTSSLLPRQIQSQALRWWNQAPQL
jgi:hypothetical protein